ERGGEMADAESGLGVGTSGHGDQLLGQLLVDGRLLRRVERHEYVVGGLIGGGVGSGGAAGGELEPGGAGARGGGGDRVVHGGMQQREGPSGVNGGRLRSGNLLYVEQRLVPIDDNHPRSGGECDAAAVPFGGRSSGGDGGRSGEHEGSDQCRQRLQRR